MLNVFDRDLNEKTKSIRSKGYIPGVIYGNKLDKSIPISVYKTDFTRLIDSKNYNGCIQLNLNNKIYKCIITDVQIDSVKDLFLHIDFKEAK